MALPRHSDIPGLPASNGQVYFGTAFRPLLVAHGAARLTAVCPSLELLLDASTFLWALANLT